MNSLIIYPQARAGDVFPVAIFSPGFNTQPPLYRQTMSHLATYGYIVIGMNFNETMTVPINHDKKGLFVPGTIDWAEKQNVDTRSPLYGLISSQKVYSFGHSAGGKSAYLGASYDTKRVAGVFAIDPVDCEPGCIFPDTKTCEYTDDFPSAAQNGNLIKPNTAVFLGAEFGGISRFGPACAPTKCSYNWFFNNSNTDQYNIMFYNTGHTQYVDTVPPPSLDPCTQGGLASATVQSLTRTLMVAWAEKTIRNVNVDEYFTGSWMKEQIDAGYLDPKQKNF